MYGFHYAKQLYYSTKNNSVILFFAILPLVYWAFLGHVITLQKKRKQLLFQMGFEPVTSWGDITFTYALSFFGLSKVGPIWTK